MRTAKGQYYEENYLSEFSDGNNDAALADVPKQNLEQNLCALAAVAENKVDSDFSPGPKNDAGDHINTESSILDVNLNSLGETPTIEQSEQHTGYRVSFSRWHQ